MQKRHPKKIECLFVLFWQNYKPKINKINNTSTHRITALFWCIHRFPYFVQSTASSFGLFSSNSQKTSLIKIAEAIKIHLHVMLSCPAIWVIFPSRHAKNPANQIHFVYNVRFISDFNFALIEFILNTPHFPVFHRQIPVRYFLASASRLIQTASLCNNHIELLRP